MIVVDLIQEHTPLVRDRYTATSKELRRRCRDVLGGRKHRILQSIPRSSSSHKLIVKTYYTSSCGKCQLCSKIGLAFGVSPGVAPVSKESTLLQLLIQCLFLSIAGRRCTSSKHGNRFVNLGRSIKQTARLCRKLIDFYQVFGDARPEVTTKLSIHMSNICIPIYLVRLLACLPTVRGVLSVFYDFCGFSKSPISITGPLKIKFTKNHIIYRYVLSHQVYSKY